MNKAFILFRLQRRKTELDRNKKAPFGAGVLLMSSLKCLTLFAFCQGGLAVFLRNDGEGSCKRRAECEKPRRQGGRGRIEWYLTHYFLRNVWRQTELRRDVTLLADELADGLLVAGSGVAESV